MYSVPIAMQSLHLIFHSRFPSEMAGALFAAKSAEAFAKQGMNITLLVSRRRGRLRDDPYAHFGVEKNFKIVHLPVLDLFGIPVIQKIAYPINFLTFSLSVFFYLLFTATKKDYIYSNEILPLLFVSSVFKETCYELHDYPEKYKAPYRLLFKRIKLILVTNRLKIEKLKKEFHVPESKIYYEPNAVSLEQFSLSLSKEEARKKVGLPQGAQVVLYTGHLYSWKGVDTLALAARDLDQVLVVIVGGNDSDRKKFIEKYQDIPNVLTVPFRPHSEIPLWQKAADILVIPNTAREKISSMYTSPLKLFEYMASGVPIVASKIASIEDIISADQAFFFTPDNPSSLSDTITYALKHRAEALKKAAQAKTAVARHSYGARAGRISEKLHE